MSARIAAETAGCGASPHMQARQWHRRPSRARYRQIALHHQACRFSSDLNRGLNRRLPACRAHLFLLQRRGSRPAKDRSHGPRTCRETSTPGAAKRETAQLYLHATKAVTAVEPARIELATSWLQSTIMAPPFSPFWRTSGEKFTDLVKDFSKLHRFGEREHVEKHLQVGQGEDQIPNASRIEPTVPRRRDCEAAGGPKPSRSTGKDLAAPAQNPVGSRILARLSFGTRRDRDCHDRGENAENGSGVGDHVMDLWDERGAILARA